MILNYNNIDFINGELINIINNFFCNKIKESLFKIFNILFYNFNQNYTMIINIRMHQIIKYKNY